MGMGRTQIKTLYRWKFFTLMAAHVFSFFPFFCCGQSHTLGCESNARHMFMGAPFLLRQTLPWYIGSNCGNVVRAVCWSDQIRRCHRRITQNSLKFVDQIASLEILFAFSLHQLVLGLHIFLVFVFFGGARTDQEEENLQDAGRRQCVKGSSTAKCWREIDELMVVKLGTFFLNIFT